MDDNFVSGLLELSAKYSAASDISAHLEDGAVRIDCDKGSFRFFYDFNRAYGEDGAVNAPLYHWRAKRKYTELRGLLDRKVIAPVLAMRVHHVSPMDNFTRSLKDIIVYETDLFEFITRKSIDRVFADISGDMYTNCIMSGEDNVKVSMELGISPKGCESVMLHEVIARTGTASDLPVDTQMTQYPIYVIKGGETRTYNEIDFELYGMDNTEADCIRFILWALTDTRRIDEVKKSCEHIEKVYRAALAAGESLTYTHVEG